MPQTTEHNPSDKKNGRQYLWTIAAISLVVTVISAYLLAGRIDNYNKNADHKMFAFIDVTIPAFAFNDRALELSEEEHDGNNLIRIRYGEESIALDVAITPRQELLPTLFDRQADWFKMLYFADRSGIKFDAFEKGVDDGTIQSRLIVVTRTPFGFEAPKDQRFEDLEHEENWAWGETRRDRWRFDFYEFMPDGSILQHEPLRFPESGKSLLRRQNYAKLKGEPIPQRGDGEIEEYTWQYGAALAVMPRAPAITFEKQALRGAGWTLPVAAGSFLLMILAFFFAIAPAKSAIEVHA
jgi:hypothetical protein